MSYYLIAMAIVTILTIIGFIVSCMWLCYKVTTDGGSHNAAYSNSPAGSKQKKRKDLGLNSNDDDDEDERNPLVGIHNGNDNQ